jgi:hypothetical protein
LHSLRCDVLEVFSCLTVDKSEAQAHVAGLGSGLPSFSRQSAGTASKVYAGLRTTAAD